MFFNNDPEAEKPAFDPGLATDWEFEDDTHIIMHLRNDVHFNDEDKTPFTAEDAKFTHLTWQSAPTPRSQAC